MSSRAAAGLAAWLLATPALPQTMYQYVDGAGVTVVVDDLAKVPASRRATATPLLEDPDVILRFEKSPEAPRSAAPSDASAAAVVAALNEVRKANGLDPVTLNAELSRGCELHAAYLVTNRTHPSVKGLGAHAERSDLPGYSAEGARCGRAAVLAPGGPAVDPVETWMGTYYHRTPLLSPLLREVGLGTRTWDSPQQAEAGRWVALDVGSGVERFCKATATSPPRAVLHPYPGQTGTRLRFVEELPDPLPGTPRPLGFPITVQFAGLPTIEGVVATLRDAKGNDVPFYLDTPQKPWNRTYNGNICLMPKAVLSRGTTYQVEVRARVDGSPWAQSWSFTTAR